MNPRIAAALEKADWECAHGGVPGHQTHRTLVREVLEEAATIPKLWAESVSCEPGVCDHIRQGAEIEHKIRALMPEVKL